MSNAPSCPISYSNAISPDAPLYHPGGKGLDPYQFARPYSLQHHINSIPIAIDLPSAIRALNIMNNIITQITHSAPILNNTVIPGGGSVLLQGIDHNPGYIRADWIEENREYETRHVVNPDDTEQKVAIKVLTRVDFNNANTGDLLMYEGSDDVMG